MSLTRMFKVLRKDLALGPRSPIFLWAIILPFALTLILQVAFGSLFAAKPRMAVVDQGASEITASLEKMDGIELTVLDNPDALKDQVRANDFDAGLILPKGFDDAVRSGEKPLLELYIGGESLSSNRIILSVTTLDLVRQVEGTAPPVDVRIENFGNEGLPISVRLVPVIMMYALFIAGAFVPSSSLVEEKENGTLSALLVSPVKASEVLVAKGLLGTILAFVMAFMTLFLNKALGGQPLVLVLVILWASAFSAVLGIVIGTAAKDSASMFTLVKGSGIFLFAPVAFYLFPEWPQWIAKLFPTFWAIDPIWQVAVLGKGLDAIWVDLAVSLAIAIALVPVIGALSRRMQRKLVAE
ncbi:MAG: ABC transporter permease [Actinobacteria bacterium]|nr:MAG: ABC transporter permease [Actinomycetota bacterium]